MTQPKYKIKPIQLKKAKELGVTIAPARNPNKKLDVFIGDKRIASIGANVSKTKGKPMMDYASYLQEEGKTIANKKRDSYLKRHSTDPKRDKKTGAPSKSFYADEILWGKPKDNINIKEVRTFDKYKSKVVKNEKEKEKKKVKKKKK